MRIGVVFPQTEIGGDPAAVKDYAQAAEDLGFTHILAYDHVVGANLASRPGWRPPYSHLDMFHEPFVLYGFLAGLTKKSNWSPASSFCPSAKPCWSPNKLRRSTC